MSLTDLIAEAWEAERANLRIDRYSPDFIFCIRRRTRGNPILFRGSHIVCEAHLSRLCARAALRALQEAGRVVVPVEPTEAMLKVGFAGWMNRNLNDPKSEPLADCYRAMIEAVRESADA